MAQKSSGQGPKPNLSPNLQTYKDRFLLHAFKQSYLRIMVVPRGSCSVTLNVPNVVMAWLVLTTPRVPLLQRSACTHFLSFIPPLKLVVVKVPMPKSIEPSTPERILLCRVFNKRSHASLQSAGVRPAFPATVVQFIRCIGPFVSKRLPMLRLSVSAF
eukprot:XP_001706053.1 Hypothetical protein GL50803_32003 [Giardia lamblia ATCC 50803]